MKARAACHPNRGDSQPAVHTDFAAARAAGARPNREGWPAANTAPGHHQLPTAGSDRWVHEEDRPGAQSLLSYRLSAGISLIMTDFVAPWHTCTHAECMDLVDSLNALAAQNRSGIAFLGAYGLTWTVCAVVWLRTTKRTAAYVTLFQGLVG